ncbi:hypothetical protein ACFSC4_01910 [Deinococcus malanensis]|uniref:hypothetical protein n=1 Tax=Deinococcus malanensis TaxID=1706855 RepID=UPI003643F704
MSRDHQRSPARVSRFLAGPSLTTAQATALAHAITASGTALPVPQTVQVQEDTLPYTPQLHLSGRVMTVHVRDRWMLRPETRTFPVAELRHAYGGLTLPDTDPGSSDGATEHMPALYRAGVLTRVRRDPRQERHALQELHHAGFDRMDRVFEEDFGLPPEAHGLLTLGDEDSWMAFMREGRDALEAQGFTLHLHPDFPLNFAEIEDWYGEADDSFGGWFTLDLGIVVDGERVSLIPVLADLIARQPELFTGEALEALDDDETLYASLGDGRRVALPAGRVRSILGVLVELHLRDLPDGPLRLPCSMPHGSRSLRAPCRPAG